MKDYINIYNDDHPSDKADKIQSICETKEELLEVFKELAARLDIAYYECMVENSKVCSRKNGLLDHDNKYTCIGCAFEDIEEFKIPCCNCLRLSKDYWRPKERG